LFCQSMSIFFIEKSVNGDSGMDYSSAENFVLGCLSEQLPAIYTFHNARHCRDVAAFAEDIALRAGVGEIDVLMLKTAGVFHDAGYMFRYDKNETDGAAFAARELPRFGYPPEAVSLIGSLIMATVYPQRPQTFLEKILCDADMYYLVTPEAVSLIDCYRSELANIGRVFSDDEWYALEENFLRGQHFFIDFCEEAYQLRMPELMKQIRKDDKA